MFRSISLCAVALVVSAAPALAQTDAKPKPRASKPPAAIEISNQRQIKLTMFELATAGDNSRTIAKLAKPLDGGKKAKVEDEAWRGTPVEDRIRHALVSGNDKHIVEDTEVRALLDALAARAPSNGHPT